MSLDPRHWGHTVWTVIFHVARVWDDRGIVERNRWASILELLPCRHCRTCALNFLSNFTWAPYVVVPNQLFIYYLRGHVNRKLFAQEYRAARTEMERQSVLRLWYGYEPHFIDVLQKNRQLPNDELLVALAHTLCYFVYHRHSTAMYEGLLYVCTGQISLPTLDILHSQIQTRLQSIIRYVNELCAAQHLHVRLHHNALFDLCRAADLNLRAEYSTDKSSRYDKTVYTASTHTVGQHALVGGTGGDECILDVVGVTPRTRQSTINDGGTIPQ